MCLNSSYSDHLEVMSSGDSTVASVSVPETNKLNSSNRTESNEKDIRTTNSSPILPPNSTTTTTTTTVAPISDDVNVTSDTSASESFDLREEEQSTSNNDNTNGDGSHPQPFSSISTSESSDNISLGKEVASLEVTTLFEEGELKRDDARSAFEITSVRLANTEELERSVRKNPVSNDSLRVTLPEKGESGDSIVNDDDKEMTEGDSEHSEIKTTPKFVVDNVISDDEIDDEGEDDKKLNRGASKLTVSPSNTNLIAEDPGKGGGGGGGGGTLIPPSFTGVGTMAMVNGTGAQFRRVNLYDRGRWTVRDSLVTEEQAESVPPQKNQFSATKQQDPENITPPRPPQQQQAASLNDLQSFDQLALISGSDVTSDRDNIPVDRSSTAAETISRNTSMSSIAAAVEKSIDGDETVRDVDEGVVVTGGINFSLGGLAVGTGNSGVGPEQDVIDPTMSSQPPFVLTSSVGAIPPPFSTAMPLREEAHATTDIDKVDFKRVEHAMSVLQNELKEVLTSSSYPILVEENRVLKDQHLSMYATNSTLRNELKQSKDELQKMKNDNAKLKKELAELRRSLSVLAQITPQYSANSPRVEESSISVSASHPSAGGGTEPHHQQTITPAASSSSNNTSLDYPPHEST